MNELFHKIKSDLNIVPYKGETDESLISRLSYSALGFWCLSISVSETNGIQGVSKKTQTSTLESVLSEFKCIYPGISQFTDDAKGRDVLSVKIRRLYEDTGYLITDNSNRNSSSPYGIHVSTEEYKDILFGIPMMGKFEMNGLGIYVDKVDEAVPVDQFLSRRECSFVDFIKTQYDICDFEERDIDVSELTFFNPLLKSPPSQSWQDHLETEYSLARKTGFGPYYKVIKISDGKLLFCEEPFHNKNSGFFSENFRRLYFSLRAYYNNPQPAWVKKIDSNYMSLQLSAKLPTREYDLLLLTSWPMVNAFSTQQYLLRKELLPVIKHSLNAIDIKIKEF